MGFQTNISFQVCISRGLPGPIQPVLEDWIPELVCYFETPPNDPNDPSFLCLPTEAIWTIWRIPDPLILFPLVFHIQDRGRLRLLLVLFSQLFIQFLFSIMSSPCLTGSLHCILWTGSCILTSCILSEHSGFTSVWVSRMSHFQWQVIGPMKSLFNATSSHDSRCCFVLVCPACICVLKNSKLILKNRNSEMLSLRALPPALWVPRIPRIAHQNSCGCLDEGTGAFLQDGWWV